MSPEQIEVQVEALLRSGRAGSFLCPSCGAEASDNHEFPYCPTGCSGEAMLAALGAEPPECPSKGYGHDAWACPTCLQRRAWARDEADRRASAASSGAGSTHIDLAMELADGRVPPEPVPDMLHRLDGHALLYRGAINRLFGDYHSGKTWVVLAAAAEVLASGGRVAIVDADLMGWRRFARRLVQLGVPVDVLADDERFRLWMPEGNDGMRTTVQQVIAWSPDLVALDSLGGVLARLRKSRNNPDDVADAMLVLGSLAADPRMCVVLLDHLAQSAESRKFGPSGSLEKGREVRGVSLRVEVIRPFVPGKGGEARLSVEKDTDGGVLARSEEGRGKREPVAGVFALHPQGSDPSAAASLSWDVGMPTPGDLTADGIEVIDVEALERLSRALEMNGPLSRTAARKAAKVRDVVVPELLDLLEAGGYVRKFKRGQAHMAESTKPYRKGDPLPGNDDEESTS